VPIVEQAQTGLFIGEMPTSPAALSSIKTTVDCLSNDINRWKCLRFVAIFNASAWRVSRVPRSLELELLFLVNILVEKSPENGLGLMVALHLKTSH
jgi:hypothetical protein